MPLNLVNIGASPNDGNGDTLREALSKVNQNFNHVEGELTTHASSSDHDSRYYTQAQVDGALSGKLETTHASSSDHDSRYYTQAQINDSLNLKLDIANIADNLTTALSTSALSANQGMQLKSMIDAINAVLASDDTTLDELQEIVNYIKLNRSDLDNLSITSIAGLQGVLDLKANVNTANSFVGNQSITGNLSATGNLLIGSASASQFSASKFSQIAGASGKSSSEVAVLDGTNNHRIGIFVDTIGNTVGINTGSSSGVYSGLSFQIEDVEALLIDRSRNSHFSGVVRVKGSSTELSGTSNTYGLYCYTKASGEANIESVTSGAGNTSLVLRTYTNGTYNNVIRNTSGGLTTFQTNGVTRATLSNSGLNITGDSNFVTVGVENDSNNKFSILGYSSTYASGSILSVGANNFAITAAGELGINSIGTMRFGIGNTEAMRLHSNRNLTIGGTTDFGARLGVIGAIKATARIELGASGTGTGGNTRYIDDSGTSRWLEGLLGTAGATNWSLYDIAAAVSRITVNSANGNVTIGGTSDTGNRLGVIGSISATETISCTQVDLNGDYVQNIVALAGNAVDCSLGNYFTRTINGNSTFTFSNAPASRAYSFTLELTHTSGTVTWPASVKWPGDEAPTLTSGKTHVFIFVTDDGGTRWRGAALIDYID